MGAHWQRQEMDLWLMKMLYDYGPLMGSMLAKKYSTIAGCKEQKVYDRLKELRRMKMVGSEQYTGVKWEDKLSRRPKRPKNLGKVFYLTGYGVEQTKILVYDVSLTGKERSQKPEEKELEVHWQVSDIIIKTGLNFTPGKVFKYAKEIPMNFTIDLGYGDWQILFARNSKESFKNLVNLQGRILYQRGFKKRILLCGSKRQQQDYIKYLFLSHANQVHVINYQEHTMLTRLLTGDIIQDAVNTLQAEKLDTPKGGYQYLVNGKPANIFSLVTYPVETIFRLEKTITLPSYIGFNDESQQRWYEKHYPKIFERHTPFIIKEHDHPLAEPVEEKGVYRDWAADIENEYEQPSFATLWE